MEGVQYNHGRGLREGERVNKKELLREAVYRWLKDNEFPTLAPAAHYVTDAMIEDLDRLIYWYKEADEGWNDCISYHL